MRRKVPLHLRIDPALLAAVDAACGDVSRTRWVERALEARLNGVTVPVLHPRDAETLKRVGQAATAGLRST